MSIELFNKKQRIAWDAVLSGQNVYIGGLGGVGKSFLLNSIRQYLGDRAVFLAPTGIAALNIRGSTLHSTFSLPLGVCTTNHQNKVSSKTQALFEDDVVKTIVIDEISMVRADVLACIDNKLRLIKRKNIPFGGIQIVVVGDFGQLSPVVKNYGNEANVFFNNFDSPYCFTTDTWSASNFININLTEVIRQSDEELIGHLQKIHSRSEGFRDSIEYFNDNCLLDNKLRRGVDPDELEEMATFLTTTNKSANAINEDNYESLEGEEEIYHGRVFGDFREEPAPKVLKLKIGTKVMITANDETYHNGEIGYVSEMGRDYIDVMVDENNTHRVKPFTWINNEYRRASNGGLILEEKGKYTQFPIKHGYALTIHKSQGCTLDNAIIHIPKAFCHGQTYVALSRVKTLEGITLIEKLAPSDVIFDKEVADFYSGKYNNVLA